MNEKEFEYDEGTLSRLKKFIRDFNAACGEDVKRMRKDRAFAAGDQWNEYEPSETRSYPVRLTFSTKRRILGSLT